MQQMARSMFLSQEMLNNLIVFDAQYSALMTRQGNFVIEKMPTRAEGRIVLTVHKVILMNG